MSHEQIIRAWKDSDYRNSLSAEELALLPANPAGESLTEDELNSVVGGHHRGGGGWGHGGGNNTTPTYSLMQIDSACITSTTNQTVNQGIYQSSSAAVVGISVWGNVTNAGNCNQSASNNNHG
jgi:mersacidin/lichenicidin family type 2 lantibiotic